MPHADSFYVSELNFTGTALLEVSTTPSYFEIPISAWDNYAEPVTLGPYNLEKFLAEWLTCSLGFENISGASTVYYTLNYSTENANSTQLGTKGSFDFNGSSVSFNIRNTLPVISLNGKKVFLHLYTNAGTADLTYCELTYSPK